MKRPNATMVAQAWLKTVSGLPIPSTAIGRTLPNLEENSAAAASGFIQLEGVVGGSPETEVLKRQSVVGLNFWAPPRGTNSDKPAWNKAGLIVEAVVEATYGDALEIQRLLPMPTGFRNARVLTAVILTEPKEITSDESSWSGYQVDAQFNWVMMPDA